MICAGNWKMNKTPQEAEEFLHQFKKRVPTQDQASFILFVPALHFGMATKVFSGTSFYWGGQNCFYQSKGPFTGENSPQVMQAMGATHCLVGHSERRQIFSENHSMIYKKAQAVIQHKMTPVLCVGETLQQREEGSWKQTLENQLAAFSKTSPLIVAYEPLWAIGSGQAATPDQIQEAVQVIQESLLENTPILYGGSVDPEKAHELLQIKEVYGFLAGGKSLDLDSFLACHKAKKVASTKP